MPAMERTAWQKYGWLLRWGGTAAGIAYVAHLIDLDKVSTAFGRISAGALIGAIVLVALNVVAGAERWRTLLTAYGANSRPPFHEAVRLYFVSFFYNNYLPGALAGWILLRAIDPAVGLGASLLIAPLAAATTFLPITVGGAGAREAVYVTLGASLFHKTRDDALAASLALWLAHLVCGAAGSVLQLTRRK